MQRKKYLKLIEIEIRKYCIEDYETIIQQAYDVIEQMDEDELIETLGTPNEYLSELLEMNDIPKKLHWKHSKRNLTKAIVWTIIFLISLPITAYLSTNAIVTITLPDFADTLFLIAIFIVALSNSKNPLTSLLIVMFGYGITVWAPNPSSINVAYWFSLFLFFVAFKYIARFVKEKMIDFSNKKYVKYTKTTAEHNYYEDTLNSKIVLGSKNLRVNKDIRNVDLEVILSNLNLDLTNIDHDICITINSKFSGTQITVPDNCIINDQTNNSCSGVDYSIIPNKGTNIITIKGDIMCSAVHFTI